MEKSVLVALADKLYLDQAKQLFSAAYWNAGWKGDCLLLAHETEPADVKWFLNKGIIVKHCKALPCSSNKKLDVILESKAYLFTEYFKQWENVVYLDADILIRGSIDGLLNVEGIGACHSLGQTIRDNMIDLNKLDRNVVSDLKMKFDLNANAFNAGVMVFNTRIIEQNTFVVLLRFFDEYLPLALFSDQLIFNLFFYQKWSELLPVYNRTIEKNNYSTINPDLFEGILIHTVSMGDGPWKLDNIFYNEWKVNFDKAEAMDLTNVPNISPWPKEKIEDHLRKIIRRHVFGHEKGFLSKIKQFLVRGFRLTLKDTARAFVKIKQLGGFMKMNK